MEEDKPLKSGVKASTAVSGLRDAQSGSTISSNKEMTPFERIVHNSDPVVTTAIEAKHTKDLPKLVEVLRAVAKSDPSIQIDSNLELSLIHI